MDKWRTRKVDYGRKWYEVDTLSHPSAYRFSIVGEANMSIASEFEWNSQHKKYEYFQVAY